MNVGENIEGRERYPMNVRYQRDCFRDTSMNCAASYRNSIRCADPIEQVLRLVPHGPAMIRDEDGQLTAMSTLLVNTTGLWRLCAAGPSALAQK